MMPYFNNLSWGYGANPFNSFLGALLVPIFIWSTLWKGWALWKAVKDDSKPWFIALLLLNTAGILDILYIFLFSKKPYRRNK